MKHIIKVNNIYDAKDNPTRPLIAMDSNGVLFAEGGKTGPEMVDLGLSVKWAKYNIGATCEDTAESWYGGFYAWGETKTKSNYSWGTYKHANGKFSGSNMKVFTKYIPTNKPEYWYGKGDPDNKLILDADDDIATLEFGSSYRMPTKEEIEELIALPNKWVTDFKDIPGLNGCVFAKTQDELDGTFNNDTMLFIPAAGYFDGSAYSSAGYRCRLWSCSLYSTYPHYAWSLFFYPSNIYVNTNFVRYHGFSVRYVSKD